jgi:hypothetical protein
MERHAIASDGQSDSAEQSAKYDKKPLTIEETCKLMGAEIIPEEEILPAINSFIYHIGRIMGER